MGASGTPRPDPSAFADSSSALLKRGRGRGTTPPSPPLKQTPVSRLFLSKSALYTPYAQELSFCEGGVPGSSPESSRHAQEWSGGSEEPASLLDSEFDVKGRIGIGSFGEVFRARSRVDDKEYAIKKSRRRFRGLKDRETYLQEVKNYERLGTHEHCVQYVRAWEQGGFLFIQMELCKCSLAQLLDEAGPTGLPEDRIWELLTDMALGLEHVHRNGLVHLDVKSSNIYIASDNKAKVGDFGLATEASLWEEGIDGDPSYLAPELLGGTDSFVAESVDIFSLGMVLLEMASAIELPSNGQAWHDIREGKFELPQHRSHELDLLIREMINLNPGNRPSATDILNHSRCACILQARGVPKSARVRLHSHARSPLRPATMRSTGVRAVRNAAARSMEQPPTTLPSSSAAQHGEQAPRSVSPRSSTMRTLWPMQHDSEGVGDHASFHVDGDDFLEPRNLSSLFDSTVSEIVPSQQSPNRRDIDPTPSSRVLDAHAHARHRADSLERSWNFFDAELEQIKQDSRSLPSKERDYAAAARGASGSAPAAAHGPDVHAAPRCRALPFVRTVAASASAIVPGASVRRKLAISIMAIAIFAKANGLFGYNSDILLIVAAFVLGYSLASRGATPACAAP